MYFFFRIIDRILHPLRMLGYYLGKVTPGLSRLSNASPALQAALIAFLFMTVASVIAFFVEFYQPATDSGILTKKALIYLAAVTAVPVCLYFAIKLLMTPTRSVYPDIDEAWQAGVEALAELDVSVKSLPLFLVLGAGSSDRVRSVFQSSGYELLLDGAATGSAPLRWYATEEAIYLCAPSIGCAAGLVGTAESGAGMKVAAAGGGPSPIGTAHAFDQPDPSEAAAAVAFTPPTGSGSAPGRTIDLEDVLGDTAAIKQRAHDPTAEGGRALPAAEARNQRARLAYLCNQIGRARDPVCPINGVLLMLPLHAILDCESAMQASTQDDLRILRAELSLRCTALMMVTDMHREPGFLELIRRVGSPLAMATRFGHSFDRRTAPTKERLEALVQHACGAFEDWTYKLFAQPGALDKTSNGQLFATMCKIRGRFHRIFVSTLVNSLGCDREEEAEDSLLFGGCYFAAHGGEASSQGFVRGVLDKLSDGEDDLEWMGEALHRNERRRAVANLVLLTGVAGLIATGVMLWRANQGGGNADLSVARPPTEKTAGFSQHPPSRADNSRRGV